MRILYTILAIIVAIPQFIVAFFSWMLITGISEGNANKVKAYRVFITITLIISLIFYLFHLTVLRDQESDPVFIYEIPSVIFMTLTALYEIWVIYSLEMKYREPTLPITERVVYELNSIG